MFALKEDILVESRMKKILIIEDDRMVSNLIKSFLEKSNFIVQQVFSGDVAREAIGKYQPDLVILDLGLPKLDGLQVCHELREIYDEPIVVLTVCETDEEQISAFKLGADDFIIKPVSPKVLKVRLDAMLRRKPAKEARPLYALRVGNIALYPQANKCEVDGIRIHLSSLEFQLLALLLRNVGRVMTRDVIYSVLLKREYNGVERTVDVRISKLRDKLINEGMKSARIETVWSKGYILNERAD
ncbi:response regulator transcription factor [Cognaticolwellia mytili]|uniref:response regulator transcription factor n=1 Tax=Cognaticolwellia mytili TaxID=1888913 RepID=UPI000A175E96|nr:response regulator transcription factor [Cognaticolwellia mytili]